jgi:hypothetical protein
MARPQVFISSTYYDLKSTRDDIARFLREIGYDSIRHEVGSVPYARSEKLESSCYKEIENCDLLLCVIGGRFGSTSTTAPGSITQNELRTALEQGKQVFIFVDKTVHAEWQFYQNNKHLKDVKYISVSDRRVFEFIDEVSQLPIGNPLFPFDTSSDITSILREQLAGLFKRFLSEQSLIQQRRLFEELKASITTVGELAKLMTERTNQGQEVISQVLLTEHPIFAAVKKVLNNKYRIFFTDLSELDEWAAGARSLKPVEQDNWDHPGYREWFKRERHTAEGDLQHLLKIKADLFDEDGRLKPISKSAWRDEYVTFQKSKLQPDYEDDIPF